MGDYFNTISLIKIFLKWKWHFFIVMAVATIAGFLFSSTLFIKPKYTSFAIFYPANLTTYSGEGSTEQMLQWFESRVIKDSIIIKYDLAQRYGIDPSNKHFNATMKTLYNNNVNISKTQFESVRLQVRDIDPVIAKDMVNSIIELYNNLVNASHREKYLEVLQSEENKLLEKRRQLDSLTKKMISLRETYGLIDYGIQAREVTKGYLGTLDGGSMAQVNRSEVNRIKNNIESKGDTLLLLTNLLTAVTSEYTNTMYSYELAKFNVEKKLSYVTVVTHPVVSDKKSHPVRWLILLLSLISTASLFFIIIAILENSRLIREKLAE